MLGNCDDDCREVSLGYYAAPELAEFTRPRHRKAGTAIGAPRSEHVTPGGKQGAARGAGRNLI
jgi:hypothetical protein